MSEYRVDNDFHMMNTEMKHTRDIMDFITLTSPREDYMIEKRAMILNKHPGLEKYFRTLMNKVDELKEKNNENV